MRIGLVAFSIVITLALAPSSALARCMIGGEEAPCKTDNGHYRIRVPAGAGPHPAVVYLYGSLGNSAEKLSHKGFVQAFVERGYAVIVPAALDLQYASGVGSGWHLRNERGRKQRNDAQFVREVLVDAEIQHRIDRRRVLIAGMSRGGFLAWEIACHDPTLAAAYAPVAAGYLGKMPNRCAGPVRLLHTHGRSDQVVPLAENARWRSGGARMRPLDDALATIATTSGCIEPGRPARFREYDRVSWQGCVDGASVDLLLHNGGHTIPLSWYSSVVDWFEGPRRQQPTIGGGTATFRSAGQRSGGRFKKAKRASE